MPHPVDTHVGQQLRMHRTMRNMSQEALAKEVNITFQQVQKYERGVNRIGASRLWEFANILNIPVSAFFDGYGSTGASSGGMAEDGAAFQHENLFDNRENIDMVRTFASISSSDTRRKIHALAKAIVDGHTVHED